jgi:hypothetical protein
MPITGIKRQSRTNFLMLSVFEVKKIKRIGGLMEE